MMPKGAAPARSRVVGFLVSLGALLAGSGLACSLLQPPSPSATAEARRAALPDDNLAATATARAEWPLVLKDDFSQPDNDWETGKSDDRFSTGTVSITGGKYRFDLKANDGFIWWSRAINNTSTTDFYAAVDAQQITGPTSADYGIVFRWQHGNYYYFKINESGQFALSLDYFEKWETLVNWTSASAIRPGEVNRLAVGAEASHFTLYVNGEQVGEADDSRLPGGTAGVAVELNQAGDQAVFQFDNFEWRAPSEAVSVLTPTP
jgi:concanavalin A-like lectin/glucanase superfamily protein